MEKKLRIYKVPSFLGHYIWVDNLHIRLFLSNYVVQGLSCAGFENTEFFLKVVSK